MSYKLKMKEVKEFVKDRVGVKPKFIVVYERGDAIEFSKKISNTLRDLLIDYLECPTDCAKQYEAIKVYLQPKYEVGHDFKVPEGVDPYLVQDIGGYKVFGTEEGIFIQGARLTDLFKEPIAPACISPITDKVYIGWEDHNVESIPAIFNIAPDKLYFHVSYGDRAWIFDNRIDAQAMVDTLVDVKVVALGKDLLEASGC